MAKESKERKIDLGTFHKIFQINRKVQEAKTETEYIKSPSNLYRMLIECGAENAYYSYYSPETPEDEKNTFMFVKMLIMHNAKTDRKYILSTPVEANIMGPNLIISDYGIDKDIQRIVIFEGNLLEPITAKLFDKTIKNSIPRDMMNKEQAKFLKDVGKAEIDTEATYRKSLVIPNPQSHLNRARRN